MAKFLVEQKFSSLGVFISIHRVSQNKETIQIRWFGRFRTKEVFSYGIRLNCGARGCRVWWGPRGITPHLPCFCLFSVYPWGLQEQTALAAPTSFTRGIGGCGSGGGQPGGTTISQGSLPKRCPCTRPGVTGGGRLRLFKMNSA